MQDKDTAKSTFLQLFKPIFSDTYQGLWSALGVDR